MTRLPGLALSLALLAGCATEPSAPAPVIAQPAAADPQQCSSRAECTLKLSRTLLFVFDYAAAGAPLLQRDGRLLFTPAEAPPGDWPEVYIRLAEAQHSRFDFNGQCRAESCRIGVEQLLQVYRSYLAGKPCAIQVGHCEQGY